MKERKLEVVYRKTADLIPYVNNARTHSEEQVTQIASSIKEFGFCSPVLIDGENGIIAGHGRVLGAKKLGLETVPTIELTGLTEAQKKAYILADNKIALNSGWDEDLLKLELEELGGEIDLSLTGFSLDEIEDFEIGLDDEPVQESADAEIPEVPEEPKTKEGDVWILGKHRLMCGDSTDEGSVTVLMKGEKADLLLTDPPYDIDMGHESARLSSLGKRVERLRCDIEFISNFKPEAFLKIVPSLFNKNMNAYIFCNKALLPKYLNWAEENNLPFNVLVWKKPSPMPLRGCHYPDIEYLLFFRKGAIWNNNLEGVKYNRCLEFGRVQKTEETGNHPTVKPVELLINEMKISSNKESIVVDLFGGSGSTLIACEETGRYGRLMELDPKYCDVIVKRWQNLTGKQAIRESDGVAFDSL